MKIEYTQENKIPISIPKQCQRGDKEILHHDTNLYVCEFLQYDSINEQVSCSQGSIEDCLSFSTNNKQRRNGVDTIPNSKRLQDGYSLLSENQ